MDKKNLKFGTSRLEKPPRQQKGLKDTFAPTTVQFKSALFTLTLEDIQTLNNLCKKANSISGRHITKSDVVRTAIRSFKDKTPEQIIKTIQRF